MITSDEIEIQPDLLYSEESIKKIIIENKRTMELISVVSENLVKSTWYVTALIWP